MREGKHPDGSTVAAREDRHGVAQHQPARSGHLPHPHARPTTAPATSGASTRCTPTRTRSRTRSRTSRTRCARSNSRTSGRSTTGCSRRSPKCGLLLRPLPQQIEFARLNLTYVVLSQAQADPARRGAATSTAGTTRACRRSPARAAAATRPKASGSSPSASASPRPIRGSTTRCSRTACATI